MPVDPRFGAWCAECGWNVDPGAAEPEPGRIDALRRRLARRHGQHLLAEMTEDEAARPRRDASGVLAHTIALAVHGSTVALAVAGALLVVLGWSTVSQPVIGVVLILLAIALRPRFASLPDDAPVLHRTDAPRLFALVDEVAAAVGTTGVHAVVIGPEANASVGLVGVRQRRVLYLGLALWEVLTPQQRVALLGHELGHYAHGDLRHAKIVGSALRSLALWCYVLAPAQSPTFLERLGNVLLLVPRGLAHCLLMLLDRLTMQASQRAEYLADRAAARAASTEAVAELLDRLLLIDSVEMELRRESVLAQTGIGGRSRSDAGQGLWERLADHVGSVPEREYERLRRASTARGHSVDTTHPPTHARRQCVSEGKHQPALVRFDDNTPAEIAAELAAPRTRVARQVIRDYAG
ncbi:M48 family metallopeptidase [Streptomyces sp. NPDC058274]|uniref:M48 family metallopeptidase n=1 Tax=Streptomyces sp. NPDC058274 TaxID=3346416 RepID=UPI0036E00EB6